MKIVNNTDLSYKEIGIIIDTIIENGQGTTHYYGQVEWTTGKILHNGKPYEVKIEIQYLKRYTAWYIGEFE